MCGLCVLCIRYGVFQYTEGLLTAQKDSDRGRAVRTGLFRLFWDVDRSHDVGVTAAGDPARHHNHHVAWLEESPGLPCATVIKTEISTIQRHRAAVDACTDLCPCQRPPCCLHRRPIPGRAAGGRARETLLSTAATDGLPEAEQGHTRSAKSIRRDPE